MLCCCGCLKFARALTWCCVDCAIDDALGIVGSDCGLDWRMVELCCVGSCVLICHLYMAHNTDMPVCLKTWHNGYFATLFLFPIAAHLAAHMTSGIAWRLIDTQH